MSSYLDFVRCFVEEPFTKYTSYTSKGYDPSFIIQATYQGKDKMMFMNFITQGDKLTSR